MLQPLPGRQPPLQFGIIDDDPVAANCMSARLKLKYPDIAISIYSEPVVTPTLDVYFVDNNFNGQYMATKLLQEIRELNPNALVIAMSSSLNNETLQKLMNGGCNAVYDKNRPHESKAVFDVINNYLNVLNQVRGEAKRSPFGGAVQSLRELLKEWNARLSKAGV